MTDPANKPHLLLEPIWADSSMLELRLAASNASFSGQTTFYADPDEPQRLAALIEGFPHAPGDIREVELGTTTMPGYGGARLRFARQGGRGHVTVQVEIHVNPLDGQSFAESAAVQIVAVPSDIDSFVRCLRQMHRDMESPAVLWPAS